MTRAEPSEQRPPRVSEETFDRGRRRRAEIVAKAIELFADSGFRATGMGRIAAEVGLTHAGLLHHFGSKERLLEAVVALRDERDQGLFEEIIGDGGLGMVERLPLLAEHNAPHPGLAQLYSVLVAENLLPEHPAHEYFAGRFRTLRAAFAKGLVAGQERGEIRKDVDTKAVAARVIATLDGLQICWLMDPEEISLLDSHVELARALVRELAEDDQAGTARPALRQPAS